MARSRISMKRAFVVSASLPDSGRIHSDKDAALIAGRHRHVACDHECEPSDHLLLGRVWLASRQLANAICDVLVIGHGSSYGRSATDCEPAAGGTT
jgi:hypothetical protein